jgi:predicted MPP superfamily phosphohydrolase
MTFIPLLVRAAELFGMDTTARVIAWPGYLWMGFLFIFSTFLLFADVTNNFYRLVVRRVSKHFPEVISSGNLCRGVLVLAIVASFYAFSEADRIRTEHVVIDSAKLPLSTSRIRVVQISDMHIGLLSQNGRQAQIVKKIREARPDILVCTGDLVDGKLNRTDSISEYEPQAAMLASIPTPYGKFAVIGNHEVYAGLPQAIAFTQTAGFTLLRNQSVKPKGSITISGVDDRAANPGTAPNINTETALLGQVSRETFHVLLKHRPDVQPESDGHFDLQLSGHVHGGQIFPFNFLVRRKYPIPCGTTVTGAGSRIHVSRGSGTWGPPMRLFAPPEVTVIDIVPNKEAR